MIIQDEAECKKNWVHHVGEGNDWDFKAVVQSVKNVAFFHKHVGTGQPCYCRPRLAHFFLHELNFCHRKKQLHMCCETFVDKLRLMITNCGNSDGRATNSIVLMCLGNWDSKVGLWRRKTRLLLARLGRGKTLDTA